MLVYHTILKSPNIIHKPNFTSDLETKFGDF